MYVHEEPADPPCVKSCTGFIIKFVDFPVLWVSKLLAKTVLLYMEAEIIAMYHCCRELFPVINISNSFGKAVGLSMGDTTMNFYFQENNAGALVFDRNFQTSSIRLVSTM